LEKIENITKDIPFNKFVNFEEKKLAVSMLLINIGELVRLLSEELKKAHPEIPFAEITATRNIAAHGYYSLDFKSVWKTIKDDIPVLKSQIENLLK